MEEKRPPSVSSEDTESGEVGGGRHRRIYRRKKSRCDGRLWIFLLLGAVILVMGIVIGGLYFNIKTLTESTELTQVTPTYVNAIAVLCSAASVFLLFCRRLTCLVLFCVIVCTVTALLCGITAILTGTHVIQPIMHFTHCSYFLSMRQCHCHSPYRRSMLELEYTPTDPTNFIFKGTDSCESIQNILLHMLYALIGTYVLSFLLTVGAAILSVLVLRMERIRMGLFEEDTYEEIFTVSNSTATPTSSDSDDHQLSALPSNGMIPESHIIRRTRSFSQPKFPPSSEMTGEKSLPKITVSSDAPVAESQGKLKEHRRRNRRAHTLHNLDTHQLMVILSLQMRYLQENENAKSQTMLSAQQLSQQLRRALTPQPNHDRQNSVGNNVQRVRSHTPQPHHFKNRNSYHDPSQPNYENLFDPTEFIKQLKQEQSEKSENRLTVERAVTPHGTTSPRPKTPYQQLGTEYPPPQTYRKENRTPRNHYEEIDNVAECINPSVPEQIYENQETRCAVQRRNPPRGQTQIDAGQNRGHVYPAAHNNVVCVQGSSGEQRDITALLPALCPSIPRHLFDRCETPARPKSYLNAVDGSDSPQTPRREQNNLQAPNLHAHRLAEQENWQNCDADSESTESAIYAMPVKKHQPKKPARSSNAGSQSRATLPGHGDGRSAFHAVPRSKKNKSKNQWTVTTNPTDDRLQVSARLYDGDVNVYDMQKQSNHVSNVSAFFPPPPYSPPPSYTDVITHSRDSSLHSLTSSTSTSEDNVDFYQQIRKLDHRNPSHAKSQTLDSRVRQERRGRVIYPESIPYNGPPQPEYSQNGGQIWNGYQNMDNLGSRWRYENMDEFSVKEQYPVRDTTQLSARGVVPGSENYRGEVAEGSSSDSDCMETVI